MGIDGPPTAPEAGAQGQRRRRLMLLGASAVAALVIAAVLIAISQGGADDGGGGGSADGGAPADAPQVRRLYAGIPQTGASLGRPDAPLRMIEFADLQCPFCAQFARNVLPTIVKRYVRAGKLRLELRPLGFIGEDSKKAAQAAAGAAVQNHVWQFSDLFYLNQGQENSGYVTDTFLRGIARGVGLEPGPIVGASKTPIAPPLLQQAASQAKRLGVTSTPTFFIASKGEPLRQLQVSELEPGEFTAKIDAALAALQS